MPEVSKERSGVERAAILLLMPPVELRTTSASAAARAEDDQARPVAADADTGSHRAPVEVVVGDAPEAEPEGRHAGATATDEVPDPR